MLPGIILFEVLDTDKVRCVLETVARDPDRTSFVKMNPYITYSRYFSG